MAIGKLFDIQGDTIIPKQDCYLLHPIKDVIEGYPDSYQKIIAYLHYMNSMRTDDNPYADVPLEERSDQILYDLELEIDPEDVKIKKALQCVEEKYYTTFYGMYKGIKAMMDKIGMKLLTEDIDFSAKEGNAGNITRFMEKYEHLRKISNRPIETSKKNKVVQEFVEEELWLMMKTMITNASYI